MMLDLIGLSGMGLVFGIISLSLTISFFTIFKEKECDYASTVSDVSIRL